MLTAIEGYFEKGRIFLKEDAPVSSKTKVIVTFLSEGDSTKEKNRTKRFFREIRG